MRCGAARRGSESAGHRRHAAIRASRAAGEGKQRLAESGEWASERYDHEASRWEVELERDEKSARELADVDRDDPAVAAPEVTLDAALVERSRSLAAATRVRGRTTAAR